MSHFYVKSYVIVVDHVTTTVLHVAVSRKRRPLRVPGMTSLLYVVCNTLENKNMVLWKAEKNSKTQRLSEWSKIFVSSKEDLSDI